MEVSMIGLDGAKSVFQVHGVDVAGAIVIRKRISRAKVSEYFRDPPPCLVGIEHVRPRTTGVASCNRLVTRSS